MTYDFVCSQEKKYLALDHLELGIWEALEYLDTFIDDSDPDTNMSQLQHALQTAESIREMYPSQEYDWFHLTGLIHDLVRHTKKKFDKAAIDGSGCKFLSHPSSSLWHLLLLLPSFRARFLVSASMSLNGVPSVTHFQLDVHSVINRCSHNISTTMPIDNIQSIRRD